jgi:hypothetical protein
MGMQAVTRTMSDPHDAWQHVLGKVLLYEENDHIRQGLSALGIKDITDFLSMEQEDFKGFEYFFYTAGEKPDDAAVEHLQNFPLVEIKKFIQLQQWYLNQTDKEVGTWFSLTKEAFHQWRLTSHIKAEDTEVAGSSNSTNSKKTEISQFSARPKLSDYKPLKTDKEWRAWARHVLIMAASHSVDNVLELTNPPITPDEHKVYDLQNKFLFSMFSEKLLTSKSKVLLRGQQATKDSHELWQQLAKAYQGHVETDIDAGNIRNKLVTFHIGDSWRKGYCSFFDMWELLIHDLEDADDILVDESTKRSWLNKTLMTCKEFETILQTIDTTETTMLALQGSTGSGASRLPWSIWLAMLKDEAA